MTIWQDIQQGKKPWRPSLTWRSGMKRLLFSAPFLAFGFLLLYFTSSCHIDAFRVAPFRTDVDVTRRCIGIPYLWKRLQNVTHVRVDNELRLVEKIGNTASSPGRTITHSLPVTRTVLISESDGRKEMAVSEFRFGASPINHQVATDLTTFLGDPQSDHSSFVIRYTGSWTPIVLALVFLFGLGGFVAVSVPIDVAFLWIQRRYKQRARGTSRPTVTVQDDSKKAGQPV